MKGAGNEVSSLTIFLNLFVFLSLSLPLTLSFSLPLTLLVFLHLSVSLSLSYFLYIFYFLRLFLSVSFSLSLFCLSYHQTHSLSFWSRLTHWLVELFDQIFVSWSNKLNPFSSLNFLCFVLTPQTLFWVVFQKWDSNPRTWGWSHYTVLHHYNHHRGLTFISFELQWITLSFTTIPCQIFISCLYSQVFSI